MNQVLEQVYFKNTVLDWIIAASMVVLSIILIKVFRTQGLRRLKIWASKSDTKLDDAVLLLLEKYILPFMYFAAVYAAFSWLTFPPKVDGAIRVIIMLVCTYFFLRVITGFVSYLFMSFLSRNDDGEVRKKQARGLLIIINAFIWAIGIVLTLDNVGYDVTTVIAGLGIGGIAIALAAQTILGDLFSYFVIFFDRPFEIGDFIIVQDKMGVVEKVGIKTTRLRTLSGEQLVCSNKDLTDSRIHNYKRMERRRIVFKLGVTYQTSLERVKEIPGLVKDIINNTSDVQLDRGHFSGYGDFSLDFEFVYYVTGPDYNLYMDRQQEIYLAIFQAFEDRGIEFAYPTQTLFVNKDGGDSAEK